MSERPIPSLRAGEGDRDATGYPGDIPFTAAVKAQQDRRGSRRAYARMESDGGWPAILPPDLVDFIEQRDSFYIATASADGQPYIQHRGGRPGFLAVLDDRTLAFPDYEGNRQYITLGNLSENDRAMIFLMDYTNRRRIKIWGHARVVEDDPDLIARLTALDGSQPVNRAIVFHIAAWDRNCPQFISPRYAARDIEAIERPLRARIAELELQLTVFREIVAASGEKPGYDTP